MYSIEIASIFSTYPNTNLSTFGGLFDQTIGTFLLITVYMSLIDKRNADLHCGVAAIIMGLTVSVIGMSFGYNAAYALNPARDFSPRLFTLIVGFGTKTFSYGNYFFWIPLVAPMIGSFLATIFYILFINNSKVITVQ